MNFFFVVVYRLFRLAVARPHRRSIPLSRNHHPLSRALACCEACTSRQQHISCIPPYFYMSSHLLDLGSGHFIVVHVARIPGPLSCRLLSTVASCKKAETSGLRVNGLVPR